MYIHMYITLIIYMYVYYSSIPGMARRAFPPAHSAAGAAAGEAAGAAAMSWAVACIYCMYV